MRLCAVGLKLVLAISAAGVQTGWSQESFRFGDFPPTAAATQPAEGSEGETEPLLNQLRPAAPAAAVPRAGSSTSAVSAPAAVPAAPPAPADTPPPANSAPTTSNPNADSKLPDETSWAAAMEAVRARVPEIPGLTDEVRQQMTEQYTQTIEQLRKAAQFAAQTKQLRSKLASAAGDLERLQSSDGLTSESAFVLPHNLAALSMDELRASHRACDTAVNEQRALLQSLSLDIERQTARLRRGPELLSQARAKLDEVNKQLAAPPPAGEHAELTGARQVRLRAARTLQEREIELLQQESKTYEETLRVVSLQRDMVDRTLKATQRQLSQLQRALAEGEKLEAQQQAAEARRAVANAHPAVRQAASVNSELAEANSRLVAALEVTRNDLKTAEETCEELSSQYLDTRSRAQAADFSQAIGLMLRSQQAELPNTEYYRARARSRLQEQSLLNLKILEWDNERRKILDTEAVVEQHLRSVSGQLGLIEQVDVRADLIQVFSARLALYAELISNARNQLNRLNFLQAAEENLVKVVDEQATFISENILWVRSTTPLTPSLISPLSTSVVSLIDIKNWADVWKHLQSDIRTHPIFELLLLPPFWLIFMRRRLRLQLESHAQDARRSSATGFTPTLHAAACTALLAVPVAALLALFGWRLTSVAPAGEFAHALGKASLVIAGALLVVEFIRHTCLDEGLGDAHFGWKSDCLDATRRSMALVKASCLPAGFVCLLAEFTGDELMISTVGRLALIVASVAVATIAFELLRPNGALGQVVLTNSERAWTRNTYKLTTAVLVVVPIVLAFVSAIGFHYTAIRLSTRMAATWGVIALLIGVRALALRWLLVVYRRFAIKRAREKRAVLQARQAGAAETGDVSIAGDTSLDLRLAEINGQAQNIIRITAAVIGAALMIIIWRELLPALGYFNQYEFWTNGLKPPGPDGLHPPVTLVDLLFAGIWLTLTVLGCRNLPGLLDIVVLQRLPLDAGARYAASALTQYALVVIGTAICFGQIGIGWQSVHWLVAAMTVGLGFGLQEIFANFVSGIILLFERPIRVGDTVTIGTVSGTVTRIRIRATTVQDWDNKELIVPNRDFVTGNLVNWTLSNPNLRVVITVNVAFGSDTRLATKLLYDLAVANPLALNDPEPVVLFCRFGASSLEFELRVFAAGLANSRTLRHELHMAIDDAFREHNIEIAIPQQGLHLRSMPHDLSELQMQRLTGSPAADRQGAAEDPAQALIEARSNKSNKHVA